MKKFTVISHTHWDREWYRTFEAFRLNLVRLVDELLEILEKDQEYIFHLDAQTVVIEDYLEIRPNKEKLLKKYIKNGNIVVGPWYLQNDFFLTEGETTVRNLKIGIGLAKKYGNCSMVGYAPDQFGLISALPKILNGFGIDSVIFGRGFMEYEMNKGNLTRLPAPTEFVWSCEDGSKCYAIFLRRWYNNAQRIPVSKSQAEQLLEQNANAFEGNTFAPSVLLMNGVDHLFPQKDVKECISKLSDCVEIEQNRLDVYVDQLKDCLEKDEVLLTEYNGNLLKGTDYEILKGCWSSRVYLKQMNVRAQNALICRLEPLYTMLALNGLKDIYPQGEFDYLWKKLLKLHPHDSICGCSCDAVHERMVQEFAAIEEMTSSLEQRGMEQLAIHTEHYRNGEGQFLVSLLNPTEKTFEGVVRLNLDFLETHNATGVQLKRVDGSVVPCEVVGVEKLSKSIYTDNNPPAVIKVKRVKVVLPIKIEAFCCETLSATAMECVCMNGKKQVNTNYIENKNYVIGFDKVPYIIHKQTGKRVDNPIFIEDSADKGDSYIYRKSKESSLKFYPKEFNIIENGMFSKTVEFVFNVSLPVDYNFEKDCRNVLEKESKIKLSLMLEEGSDTVKANYSFDNIWCDHRLRVAFNFGEGKLITDAPFDYSERGAFEYCKYTDSNTHHNSSFISVVDSNGASSEVFSFGQHEVEKDKNTLYLTLLRSTGAISRNEKTFEVNGGEKWLVKGNQVLGNIEGVFGLRLKEYFNPIECYVGAKQFRNGIMSIVVPFDSCEYSTGLPAVQVSETTTFYPNEDKYFNTFIGCRLLPFSVKGVGVTAVKRDINNNKTVLRIINYSQESVDVSFGKDSSVAEADMMEKALTGYKKNKKIMLAPKQIKTFLIKDIVIC